MFERGDTVRLLRRGTLMPFRHRGEVIKVNEKSAVVRWQPLEREMIIWYRGGFLPVVVPEQSRVQFHNLELIERKGGPW